MFSGGLSNVKICVVLESTLDDSLIHISEAGKVELTYFKTIPDAVYGVGSCK